MTINLRPIRRIAEAITMGDTVEWTRDAGEIGEATWDEDEGVFVPPAGDRDVIYSGPASIYSGRGQELTETRGGMEVLLVRYWVAVPVDSEVEGVAEDQIQVIAVDPINGDPTLVGEIFILKSIEFGTLTATKRASCYRLSDVP